MTSYIHSVTVCERFYSRIRITPMNAGPLAETLALFDSIISELPQEYNLSSEIGRAKQSSTAVAGGHTCDIFCVEISWDGDRNETLSSRCDVTENEKGTKILKVAVKRARAYLLHGLGRDERIKFMKVCTYIYVK